MIVDGRKIAVEIKNALKRELLTRERKPSLGVIVATNDLATQKFVERKRQFGESVGISADVLELATTATTEELVEAVHVKMQEHDGVVVQLPLPSDTDVDAVRNAISVEKDVDVISDAGARAFEAGNTDVLPPVVGAIAEIARRNDIAVRGKRVVIVGSGRLVGKPAATWAKQAGGVVSIVGQGTNDIASELRTADIIISGAGVPGLIQPDMIKAGAVLFDAGTSEAAGRLAGDIDPACAKKASLCTPVPGGIGPITVAMIFKNLLALSGQ